MRRGGLIDRKLAPFFLPCNQLPTVYQFLFVLLPCKNIPRALLASMQIAPSLAYSLRLALSLEKIGVSFNWGALLSASNRRQPSHAKNPLVQSQLPTSSNYNTKIQTYCFAVKKVYKIMQNAVTLSFAMMDEIFNISPLKFFWVVIIIIKGQTVVLYYFRVKNERQEQPKVRAS